MPPSIDLYYNYSLHPDINTASNSYPFIIQVCFRIYRECRVSHTSGITINIRYYKKITRQIKPVCFKRSSEFLRYFPRKLIFLSGLFPFLRHLPFTLVKVTLQKYKINNHLKEILSQVISLEYLRPKKCIKFQLSNNIRK